MKVLLFSLTFAALILAVQAQTAYNYKKVSDSYATMNNTHTAKQLIQTLKLFSMAYCFASCSQLSSCSYIVMITDSCLLYTNRIVLKPGVNSNDLWYKSTQNSTMTVFNNSDPNLTCYWPILDGTATDLMSGTDLTSQSPIYGTDQYQMSDGTIVTTNSTTYWLAPPSVYFWGDFTFIGWVKPMSCGYYARIFEFAAGNYSDAVAFAYSTSIGSCQGYADVYTDQLYWSNTPVFLPVNQWTHAALTLCGNQLNVYFNGSFSSSVTISGFRVVTRATSYFGKSNWASVDASNAQYDEMKIYNRCLNATEIAYDRNYIKNLFTFVTLL